MALKVVVKPNLTQRLNFTPFFNLSLEVLQLNSHALKEYILASANDNPLLEVEISETAVGSSYGDSSISQELYEDKLSLRQYLLDQARLIKSYNFDLLEYCIYLIDKRGYFNEDSKKVALENSVSEKEVEIIIREIQQLDPIGVGARDLSECLLIQVNKFHPKNALLATIISNHLYDVAENDLSNIMLKTNSSEEDILQEIKILRSLNPVPGNGFEQRVSNYIIPEFELIKNTDGQLEIKLFYNWKIELNKNYQSQKEYLTKTEKEVLDKYATNGQQLITAINKREDSLKLVVSSIIEHQQEYFLNAEPLKRLRLIDLSEKTGLHVSTVCRVIKDKYYLLDNKMYPLSDLLCKGSTSSSVSEVKALISQIISKESDKALSDEKIKELLSKKGIIVSRRVVSKYRLELGYQSSYGRGRNSDLKK